MVPEGDVAFDISDHDGVRELSEQGGERLVGVLRRLFEETESRGVVGFEA